MSIVAAIRFPCEALLEDPAGARLALLNNEPAALWPQAKYEF